MVLPREPGAWPGRASSSSDASRRRSTGAARIVTLSASSKREHRRTSSGFRARAGRRSSRPASTPASRPAARRADAPAGRRRRPARAGQALRPAHRSAAPRRAAQSPDLELGIVGEGYERPALEELVATPRRRDVGDASPAASPTTSSSTCTAGRGSWPAASAREGWGMTAHRGGRLRHAGRRHPHRRPPRRRRRRRERAAGRRRSRRRPRRRARPRARRRACCASRLAEAALDAGRRAHVGRDGAAASFEALAAEAATAASRPAWTSAVRR